MGNNVLICSGGTGGCLATWKTKRHNACRNILVRLGVAAGLTPGDVIDVDARYLHTQYRPSDIRVTRRDGGPDMEFEDDTGGLILGGGSDPERGPHPGDSPVRAIAYDVTIAATQTYYNGQYGHHTATQGPGTQAAAATTEKIKKYKEKLANIRPETNHRTKFEVLAFESSGWTDGRVKSLVAAWESGRRSVGVRIGVGRRRGPAPDRSCPVKFTTATRYPSS